MAKNEPYQAVPPLWWIPGPEAPSSAPHDFQAALQQVNRPLCVIRLADGAAVGQGGRITDQDLRESGRKTYPLAAQVPPLHPENLGAACFTERHAIRYPYVIGAMANGITSVAMVKEAGQAGLIGFFGAAGLLPSAIEAAIDQLQAVRQPIPFGFNLIHSPHEPDLEAAIVNLYLERRVRLISASAYMDLTDPLIYFRVKGIHRAPDGRIVCPNKVVAKVSRVEVARKFFGPPPEKNLRRLVNQKLITEPEAALSAFIPVAEDLTAEADSGGHTDNRPALALFPTMRALRDELQHKHQYPMQLCVGLAGGIATPESTAAAFAMGAAYVLTGSINQACLESGTSPKVRQMLAETNQADVTMAPSADMFELGVKVQVLKRGTMFPLRAAKLYDLYRQYDSWKQVPSVQRQTIERDLLQSTFEEAWELTKAFFNHRDPRQIERAEANPRHKMALVFRSYLGRSSGWANSGDPSRVMDYQIWCGPAMGAFNAWVRGSCLEPPLNRKVVVVALNLLLGASVLTRTHWLRCQGVDLPPGVDGYAPLPLEAVLKCLDPAPETLPA